LKTQYRPEFAVFLRQQNASRRFGEQITKTGERKQISPEFAVFLR